MGILVGFFRVFPLRVCIVVVRSLAQNKPVNLVRGFLSRPPVGHQYGGLFCGPARLGVVHGRRNWGNGLSRNRNSDQRVPSTVVRGHGGFVRGQRLSIC